MRIKDLTDKVFGNLTVEQRTNVKNKYGSYMWICRCDCGNLTAVSSSHLSSGKTKSCGCSKIFNNSMRKHGRYNTRLYGIWSTIKDRCINTKSRDYHDYGNRGIKICDEWLNNFQAFYDWSMLHGYSDNLTIDRKDNNQGYSPDNCRWTTMGEQMRNKRNNRKITYNGETMCLMSWSEKLNIKYTTLSGRLNRGWSIEDAFTIPLNKGHYKRNL